MKRLLVCACSVMPLVLMVGDTEGLEQNALRPLAAEVVNAWKDAGAELEVGPPPGFKFRKWPAADLAALPHPQAPFNLDFRYMRFVDEDLRDLADFAHLQTLDLFRTQVTNGGLDALKGMDNLQELNLSGTPVTDAGVAALKKAKPDLRTNPLNP
jgi:hypothetical protein